MANVMIAAVKAMAAGLLFTVLNGCQFSQVERDGVIYGYALPYSAVSVRNEYAEVVGRAVAGKDGYFELVVTNLKPQPLMLSATGGEYYAFGTEFPARVGEEFAEHAVTTYINGEKNGVKIGYESTLAAGLAEYYMSNGMPADTAVVRANEIVAGWLGFNDWGLSAQTDPLDAGASERTIDSGTVLRVNQMKELNDLSRRTIIEAAISELVSLVNKDGSLTGEQQLTRQQFTMDAYDDIRYDGMLNGVAAGVSIAHGNVSLDQDYYRHKFALSIGRVLQSELNASQISARDVDAWVTDINENTDDIFGNFQATDIPINEPYLAFSGIENGGVISGNWPVEYQLFDFDGIESISMFIDQVEIALPVGSTSYTIDSSYFKNEAYDIRIVATNVQGNQNQISLTATLNNTVDDNFVLTPSGELKSGEVTFNVALADTYGVAEVQFVIDSTPIFSTTEIGSSISYVYDTADLPSDGEHTFRVNIISNAGNTSYKSTTFTTDNTAPIITWPLTDGTLLDTIHTFSANVAEDQGIGSVRFLYDGLEVEKIEDAPGETDLDVEVTIDTRTIYEGSHQMSIEAFSEAGMRAVEERQVEVDWTYPTINIVTASGTKLLKGGTLNVEFQAQDSNGIQKVEYYVDGVKLGTLAAGVNAFTINNNAGEVKDAVVSVVATDLVGRTATDNIIVRYEILTIGNPVVAKLDNARGTLTFQVTGVNSSAFTPVFILTDDGQQGYAASVTVATAFNPATEIGTAVVTFPGKVYSSGCGINWEPMRFTFYISYHDSVSNVITSTTSELPGDKMYIETPSTGCGGGGNLPPGE